MHTSIYNFKMTVVLNYGSNNLLLNYAFMRKHILIVTSADIVMYNKALI